MTSYDCIYSNHSIFEFFIAMVSPVTTVSSNSQKTDLFGNYYLYHTEVLTIRFPTMLEASLHFALKESGCYY